MESHGAHTLCGRGRHTQPPYHPQRDSHEEVRRRRSVAQESRPRSRGQTTGEGRNRGKPFARSDYWIETSPASCSLEGLPASARRPAYPSRLNLALWHPGEHLDISEKAMILRRGSPVIGVVLVQPTKRPAVHAPSSSTLLLATPVYECGEQPLLLLSIVPNIAYVIRYSLPRS